MGMSTSVVGIKPADSKWRQMKAIWDACEAAEVQVPNEVGHYFGWEEPDDEGVRIDIAEDKNAVIGIGQYNEGGFIIYLDRLPEDVKIIKFENSW
jgi:hypothetical protein